MNLPTRGSGQHGQMIALFALSLTVIILIAGLAVDGGYAFMQRRSSQNASDFGALAGARVVAFFISGDTTNGTDVNVASSITAAVTANGGTVTFGAPNGPVYTAANGATLGYVGTGTIPVGSVGVKVSSTRSWNPFFLGVIGMQNWQASAPATAKGGWAAGGPGGNVFPAGISSTFFQTYPLCSGPINYVDPNDPCYPKNLTPGNLNVPGGFGWLKFGATGKCTGYGLGMDPNNDCDPSAVFLNTEIGPHPNGFGCCATVTGAASPEDQIRSLPGNQVSADCSYYVNNGIASPCPCGTPPAAPARTPTATSSATRGSRSPVAPVPRTSQAPAERGLPGPDDALARVRRRAAGGPADQVATCSPPCSLRTRTCGLNSQRVVLTAPRPSRRR